MGSSKWIFPVAMLSLALAACGGGGGGNSNSKDVVDETACQGAPPADATIYSTWYQRQMVDGVENDTTITISPNQINQTVKCVWSSGAAASATTSAPLTVNSNSFTILQAASNVGEFWQDDTHVFKCESGLPAMTASYELVGSCLKVRAMGKTILLQH